MNRRRSAVSILPYFDEETSMSRWLMVATLALVLGVGPLVSHLLAEDPPIPRFDGNVTEVDPKPDKENGIFVRVQCEGPQNPWPILTREIWIEGKKATPQQLADLLAQTKKAGRELAVTVFWKGEREKGKKEKEVDPERRGSGHRLLADKIVHPPVRK
jgi:hypothetical protein